MAGLVPAIHLFFPATVYNDANTRHKAGHDKVELAHDNKHEQKSGIRIAKVIARAGLCSRREAEQWIAAGRVAVNGTVIATPALNVGARDRITVDGAPLPARERTRLFLYHKPRGLVSTRSDPQGRPTVFERLPKGLPRLVGIGRLDFNTEGLLLLTNDGGLARALELPQTGWLRRYRVRAHGSVTQAALDRLRAGLTIDGVRYGPIEATLDRTQGSNVWLTFAIREGKNREVRNVLGHLGLAVTRLIRISFGPFQLGELAEGAVEEVRTRVLREQLGERVIALSGADFSAPAAQGEEHRPLHRRPEGLAAGRRASKGDGPGAAAVRSSRAAEFTIGPAEGRTRWRPPLDDGIEIRAHRRHQEKPASHAWRQRTEQAKPPLRRKFRGARRDREREPPHGDAAAGKRAGLLTDRKGRRVLVERVAPAAPAEPREEARLPPRRPKRGRRRPPDRGSGPRPSRPRGR
jgi:23S rRNA pseudouridine2605 synthase